MFYYINADKIKPNQPSLFDQVVHQGSTAFKVIPNTEHFKLDSDISIDIQPRNKLPHNAYLKTLSDLCQHFIDNKVELNVLLCNQLLLLFN
jgi:hypothetical protein